MDQLSQTHSRRYLSIKGSLWQLGLHENQFQKLIEKESKKFDKFPTSLVSIDDWPRRTNLKCWNCSLRILNLPWPIPKSIDTYCNTDNFSTPNSIIFTNKSTIRDKNKNLMISVEGIACSFCCATTYIREQSGDYSDKQNKEKILNYVFKLIKKKSVLHIPTGPTKIQLLEYGGDDTEEELRKKIENIESNMQVV